MSPKISLLAFLHYFPVIELPVSLTDESQRLFSEKNEPLPARLIEAFILPMEEDAPDEFMEFVPCFSIPDTHEFHAIVYWRARLMDYQYILAVLNKKGELMDRKVIAGTFSDGSVLTQSVAHIEPDWEIIIVSGLQATNAQGHYEAKDSTSYSLELLPSGKIVRI